VPHVPALELDDGTTISESVAIGRYLEALYPEPNLFGVDAREQARGRDVDAAQRVLSRQSDHAERAPHPSGHGGAGGVQMPEVADYNRLGPSAS
jgi:glutathione S-transferase